MAKLFIAIVGAVGIASSLLFVGITWLAGGLVDRFAGDIIGPGAATGGDPGAAIASQATNVTPYLRIAGLVCALPFALFFGYLVLRMLRSRAWLDGTTLVQQGALSRRRVDLATADVTGDTVTHTGTSGQYRYIYTIAAVAARDPSTGARVKIPLRAQGLKRLPAGELVALADAIMVTRRPGAPSFANAAAIATRLREMAANPFPV